MSYTFVNDERIATSEGFSKFKQSVEFYVQHPGVAGKNKFYFPEDHFIDCVARIIIEFDYETIRKEQALLEEKKKELANIKRPLFDRLFKGPPMPQINVSDSTVKVTMELLMENGEYSSDYDSGIGTEMMSYDKFLSYNQPIFFRDFIEKKFNALIEKFDVAHN